MDCRWRLSVPRILALTASSQSRMITFVSFVLSVRIGVRRLRHDFHALPLPTYFSNLAVVNMTDFRFALLHGFHWRRGCPRRVRTVAIESGVDAIPMEKIQPNCCEWPLNRLVWLRCRSESLHLSFSETIRAIKSVIETSLFLRYGREVASPLFHALFPHCFSIPFTPPESCFLIPWAFCGLLMISPLQFRE